MTSNKEIGGYFGLELNSKYDNIKDAIALNCARNCLKYVIRAYKIKEIYLPYYTCPTVWQAAKKENCKIKFYHIDKNFMPLSDFDKDAYILYTNYFGVCGKNVKEMAKKYKNLIIDNTHAFYMPPYGIASFNSIRKFFGVPDGALLLCDKTLDEKFEQATSYQRFSHIIKRTDIDAKFGYSDFCKHEDLLNNEDIKYMSNITKYIFNSIDIKPAKSKRLENFEYLDKHLSSTNELSLQLIKEDVPMFYPYFTRDENLRNKLLSNNIYVEQYWSATPKKNVEGEFQKYIIPIPLDQRYNEKDMKKIVEQIL